MQEGGKSFTEEELIAKVISKNIPSAWVKDFRMFKLHLKTRIRDVLTDLTVMEEQVKTNLKPSNSDKKQHLKNPCRIHNGGHEWDDCCQNPKNIKSDDQNKTNGRTDHNGSWTRENRRTENDGQTPRSRSNSQTRSTDSEYEYHGISEHEEIKDKFIPSSEILVALPDVEHSRKYTTYIGLIDSGSSGSLINSDIVQKGNFTTLINKKPIQWDTATGTLLTQGTVDIKKRCLPQFTTDRHVASTFHTLTKRPNDKYDVILGRDLLQSIGLDTHYSASQFTWDSISVAMVPSGYWSKEKIEHIDASWNNKHEEAHITEILPAEYKPCDINAIVNEQTHLSTIEKDKLRSVLLEFSDLFKGECGKYNGDPIDLELIPGAKSFYGKPFSIPKAYEQVTKNEIKRLEQLGLLTYTSQILPVGSTHLYHPKKE
jgi:hypothetical protein